MSAEINKFRLSHLLRYPVLVQSEDLDVSKTFGKVQIRKIGIRLLVQLREVPSKKHEKIFSDNILYLIC